MLYIIMLLQDKFTALIYAAIRGHTDVVQVLLSRQDVGIHMTDKVIIRWVLWESVSEPNLSYLECQIWVNFPSSDHNNWGVWHLDSVYT